MGYWKEINLCRKDLVIVFPLLGYLVGNYLDRKETERMTRFRGRSALYGRERFPGEKPAW